MKNLILIIALLAVVSGCSYTQNTVTTEKFLAPDGTVERVVVTQELSDDAFYYVEAGKAISGDSAAECSNCSAEGKVAIEAFKTIRVMSGKQFVDRGMSGVEAAASVGGAIISQSPAYMLGLGLYKALDRPSSVTLNGDDNTYSPSEWHWTGNKMEDGNSFPSSYRYQSHDTITTTNHGGVLP